MRPREERQWFERTGKCSKQNSAAIPRRAAGVLIALSENSAIDFKQPGAALAAADAHGDDAPFGLAPAALLQDVAGQPRAGHAEGMADRDRAAVDVVLVGIDAELVARIQALAGEGLVEFPQIDIPHLEAVALQQFWHREHRADAHLVRFTAR